MSNKYSTFGGLWRFFLGFLVPAFLIGFIFGISWTGVLLIGILLSIAMYITRE